MSKEHKTLYIPSAKKTLKDGFVVFATTIITSTVIALISFCVNILMS